MQEVVHNCPECGSPIDQENVHEDRTMEGEHVPNHVHCQNCETRSEIVGDEDGIMLSHTTKGRSSVS